MQIEGTNNSPCPEEIEKELANARNELEKYKKMHEEMINEIKKVTFRPTIINQYQDCWVWA